MRTWYVPLEILDDNRMIAQHREIHTVLGSITSVKRGYINHPVTKLYLGEHLDCLVDYHAETVAEMERRGWHGHKTPVSDKVLEEASLRYTDDTCGGWTRHVNVMVPLTGPFSIETDMHDLVQRWTNEGKGLRNDRARHWTIEHRDTCQDRDCVQRATKLIYEYRFNLDVCEGNPLRIYKVKGNASLRGKPEFMGATA